MKKFNTTFLLVVAVLVVAVFLYYYFNPSKPWLEGFQTEISISKQTVVGALIFLHKAYKGVDISASKIENDSIGLTQCGRTLTIECIDALLAKYAIVPETLLPATPAVNLELPAVTMTLDLLRTRKGVANPQVSSSDLNAALVSDTIACAKTTVGGVDYIKPVCYNMLLKKFLLDVPAAPVAAVAPVQAEAVAPAQSTKDYRISFFKNLALIAGETKLKTDAIEAAYDKMASCKKDNSDYDIDCFHELAAEFDITITKEAMDSVGVPTDKKKDSTIDDVLSTALKALKKDDADTSASTGTKCKVEFGKEPPVEIPDVSKPESTCTTTSDVVKDTKTPAVSQGCDFANKFPKVNVINLRDYVHKDEIPCWSCKL
jgi:hypothetical protein